MLLAFAYHKRFTLYQMNVKRAFLNDFIQKEVFIKQPPNFKDHEYPNFIFKPRKTIYDLKQALRVWYERIE